MPNTLRPTQDSKVITDFFSRLLKSNTFKDPIVLAACSPNTKIRQRAHYCILLLQSKFTTCSSNRGINHEQSDFLSRCHEEVLRIGCNIEKILINRAQTTRFEKELDKIHSAEFFSSLIERLKVRDGISDEMAYWEIANRCQELSQALKSIELPDNHLYRIIKDVVSPASVLTRLIYLKRTAGNWSFLNVGHTHIFLKNPFFLKPHAGMLATAKHTAALAIANIFSNL